jgi:hypothetical protein
LINLGISLNVGLLSFSFIWGAFLNVNSAWVGALGEVVLAVNSDFLAAAIAPDDEHFTQKSRSNTLVRVYFQSPSLP